MLEADLLDDEEECLLRDHLLAVHPNTIQPETRSVLFRHFVVTEPPGPQRSRAYSECSQALDLAQEFGDAVHRDLGGDSGTASTRPHSAAPVKRCRQCRWLRDRPCSPLG